MVQIDRAHASLMIEDKKYDYFSLPEFAKVMDADFSRLPISIKILLEAALRHYDGKLITKQHIDQLVNWGDSELIRTEIPFIPARIILQDFTGVPAVVDLAAMREAMVQSGGEPQKINPLIPVDLVIDHSLMVDQAASSEAFDFNLEREFARNQERYTFLRWAQEAFSNFRVIPPGTGIIHQVNLEYLADVVVRQEQDAGGTLIYPDTLVGTDSHTTMINGLGVLGWGVGGIEAEAGMLGQPLYFVAPEVVGCNLTGKLMEGVTATDLALTIVELLRKEDVVGKIVEFYGDGLDGMSLEDRATVANMAPEYGATMGYFPVDKETLNYLLLTGRDEELVELVESYYKEQELFRPQVEGLVNYSELIGLDLTTVEPSIAGPKRPQDRIKLSEAKMDWEHTNLNAARAVEVDKKTDEVEDKAPVVDGSVVIAALTSCTNTSNPSVMIAAGLIAKKAVELGLQSAPHVKTSLTPGSRVVSDYLENANLLEPLAELGFQVVGYGCATCIGNSGPLAKEVNKRIMEDNLTVASVISGNRNFEGRVHPLVKANYLASPPLVVIYALAGRIDIDLTTEAVAYNVAGEPIYMKDLWPTSEEIARALKSAVNPAIFRKQYSDIFKANSLWNDIHVTKDELYNWDADSTYIQNPPFFTETDTVGKEIQHSNDIIDARILAIYGDSVTTDHISPAGNIAKDSPAGQYLLDKGVPEKEFNSYGSRRGNHQVMMRGTFANIRIRNKIVPEIVGGMTKYFPTGEIMSIYDAAVGYQADGTPLVILAGKEYGTGSSRDWAAKGPSLLGVKAVIAESFERIHRSNLVGMGILPLELADNQSWQELALTGEESVSITGLNQELQPQEKIAVQLRRPDGSLLELETILRLDSVIDIEYYFNGGILQTVLRKLK